MGERYGKCKSCGGKGFKILPNEADPEKKDEIDCFSCDGMGFETQHPHCWNQIQMTQIKSVWDES